MSLKRLDNRYGYRSRTVSLGRVINVPEIQHGVWARGRGVQGLGAGAAQQGPPGRDPGVGASPAARSWPLQPGQAAHAASAHDDDLLFNLFFISIKHPESCKYMCSPIDAREPLMLIYSSEVQLIHNCTLKKGY